MHLIQAMLAILPLVSPTSSPGRLPNCASGAPSVSKPGVFPGPASSVCDYNETILQLALEKELGFAGRVLRMHYSTMAPSGIIGQHSHKDRPTIEYILHGIATETKKVGAAQAIVRQVKEDTTELSTVDTIHWWKNDSRRMVQIMAVDIWVGTTSVTCRPQGNPRSEPLRPPSASDNVKVEEMGSLDLAVQLPQIVEAQKYMLRSRRLTLLPGQKTKLLNATGNPGIMYVIKGEIWENRSDEAASIRRTGEYSALSNGLLFYWENTTTQPVILWVVDIAAK